MRLTSTATLSVSLLSLAFLVACPGPPSSEGSSNGDGDSTTNGDGDGDGNDDSPQIICSPGETDCKDPQTLLICAPTGLEWDEVPCEGYEICDPTWQNEDGDTAPTCVGPCERLEDSPSSEGCSFYTTSMYQASLPQGTVEEPPDGIAVGNPQLEDVATVELRYVPFGSNQEELVTEIDGVPIENPVTIQPGESHVFSLDPDLTIYFTDNTEETSLYRSGVVYHVVSDLPVVAYLHAPLVKQNTNGSTLLLPEHTLQGDYVIPGHGAWIDPNSVTIIAMHNQTTVTWRPSVETAGDNLPLPFVPDGQAGMQLLNRFDNMRIDTSKKEMRPKCEQDLSGTIIEADKPIWVVSSVLALRLPWCGSSAVPGCPDAPENIDTACNFGSDFAMEQILPLDYWGREYVGPHSPIRGGEKHHWRIYAGEDDVTVTVTPPQPNTPVSLATRGDWAEIIVDEGTHLEFDGDGVFMPVQFVTGHYDTDAVGTERKGSPAMIQMVPTAQFLNRYVFVTGVGYPEHYVQVIREAGAGDILLDGAAVGGWEAVGEWEVATALVSEGPHEIASAVAQDSFGILQYGYSFHESGASNSSGYGYMGGMKAEVIYIP